MSGGDGQPRLEISPLSCKEANRLVARWHRHHRPTHNQLFALGVALGDDLVGAAIVARPVSRLLEDGYTAEVVRCATDGTKNACSKLYGAAWRAARALGYRKLITYTLPEEGGSSLRASGFKLLGIAGGGTWARKDRPRIDDHPLQQKLRWEKTP
jgi:hypothetical protein